MGVLSKHLKQLKDKVTGKTVAAGWFPSSVYPNGASVAMVATVQEYGRTESNIPARPFLRPTIQAKSNEWVEIARKEITKGGNNPLEVVALVMEADIRDAIIAVETPVLTDKTIAARKRRGNSNTNPLTDTGHMLSSLIGVVKDEPA